MFTSEKMVKFLREKYPPGTRIRLVSMTNYDPRTFAPQMSFFSEYGSGDKTCKLIHIPEKPRKI